jgi:hypothetical protein
MHYLVYIRYLCIKRNWSLLSCWILMLAASQWREKSIRDSSLVTNSVCPIRKPIRRSSLVASRMSNEIVRNFRHIWFLFHYFIAYKIQYSYNRSYYATNVSASFSRKVMHILHACPLSHWSIKRFKQSNTVHTLSVPKLHEGKDIVSEIS